MEFDLQETLLAANLTRNLKFQGLCNTSELRYTMLGFFYGSEFRIVINKVQGKSEELRAELAADIKTSDGVKELIEVFERNTLLTLRSLIIK